MNPENKIKFNSPLLKDFDPYGYKFHGMWSNPIFSSSFWQDCVSEDLVKRLNLDLTETGAASLCGGNYLVKNSVSSKIFNQIKDRILNGDKAFFDNIKKVTDSIAREAIEYSETIKEEKVSVESVLIFFSELRKLNFLWYLGAHNFTDPAEQVLADLVVKEGFPADLVPDLIPRIVSPLVHQQEEVLRLKKLIGDRTLDEVKKDSEIFSKMEEHVNKYFWIEIFNFSGELLTVDRLYEQITHTKYSADHFKKELPSVSEKLKFAAECMSTCGYVKQNSAEYFSILSAKSYDFLKSIAKELELEYRQFTMLTPEEVLAGLRGEIKKDDLRERGIRRADLNWFLFANDKGQAVVVEDKEDIEILKDIMLPKVDKDILEVRGVTAYPGKVRGIARIVMNRDEFDKMKTGDILISTMTTPDFVILMQQASAIVTDIGGVLCHAAIVSREIHKPCIIGTKNATKIIKDGDMVEVDADRGIIRRINKI